MCYRSSTCMYVCMYMFMPGIMENRRGMNLLDLELHVVAGTGTPPPVSWRSESALNHQAISPPTPFKCILLGVCVCLCLCVTTLCRGWGKPPKWFSPSTTWALRTEHKLPLPSEPSPLTHLSFLKCWFKRQHQHLCPMYQESGIWRSGDFNRTWHICRCAQSALRASHNCLFSFLSSFSPSLLLFSFPFTLTESPFMVQIGKYKYWRRAGVWRTILFHTQWEGNTGLCAATVYHDVRWSFHMLKTGKLRKREGG